MSIKNRFRKIINSVLDNFGHEIIRSSYLYDWQRNISSKPSYKKMGLPEGAASYLNERTPRLQEISDRYNKFDNHVTKPLDWNAEYVKSDDIKFFRGDNAYVWQVRGVNMNILTYALTTYYLKSIDKYNLLNKLTEDKLFGIHSFEIDNKIITRDLLDSISEIYFLEDKLNISNFDNLKILDIGSGYGRLAHRVYEALPNLSNYLCTDAVAYSSFISEFYIKYRKLSDKVEVVLLDEIEDKLTNLKPDIAVNIHSFAECKVDAIKWWINLIMKNEVKYLMIVANAYKENGKVILPTNEKKDFFQIIQDNNYKLISFEPKYNDPILNKYGLNPTNHLLFKLS